MSAPSSDLIGDEYEVVSLRFGWAGLSLVFFLLTMLARPLLRLQPWRPAEPWIWTLVPVAAISILALAGLLCGLAGLRSAAGKGIAKIGIVLNAVVLGSIVLVVAGMVFVVFLR